MFIAPMRNMVPSKSKPLNNGLVKMLPQVRVAQHFGMPAPEILASGDKEAAGAGSWIADDVRRRRLGQLDHQRDDMPGRTKLAVLPGGRDLAKHVFVDITLGVAIVHPDSVKLLDRLREQSRRLDA